MIAYAAPRKCFLEENRPGSTKRWIDGLIGRGCDLRPTARLGDVRRLSWHDNLRGKSSVPLEEK